MGRRHDSPSSSPSRSRSRSRRRGATGDDDADERARKAERKEKKAAKKAAKKQRKREKKERKRSKKEEKRATKKKRSRERSDASDTSDDDRRDANTAVHDDADKPKRSKGGLQMRSAEIVAKEKAEREAAAAAEAAERTRAQAEAEAEAARIAEEAMRAANVDMDHEPVPGFGAAMTLEQYRAMSAGKTYMKGTLHATPKEEKEEMDDKAKKGFWPCQSYKCTKSGSNHMNPKYAEKCTRCGAMKPLGAGSDVFNHGMSEKAYLQNQSKYR